MTPFIITGVVAIAAGAAAAWKVANWRSASRVARAELATDESDKALTKAKATIAALEEQLAAERRTWAEAEARRDDIEARLRTALAHERKDLLDAASRDPVLAGDRLDDVLRAGRGVTARGNAAAPVALPGPRATPGAPRGDDDETR